MGTRHPLYPLDLRPGWELTTVDNIKSPEPHACVAGPFGSNISSKYFVDVGVPVIRGINLRDDLTRFVPEKFVYVSEDRAVAYKGQHVIAGDLVFTCWGTIGQVGLIPSDGPYSSYIISNKQLKLRANRACVDVRYLFYYFAGPAMVDYIRGRAIGAAVPGINLGILKALPVVLPPLDLQQRIADVLSAYDDLIANSQKRIGILEEMAHALCREWFFRSGSSVCVVRTTAQRLIDDGVLEINDGYRAKNTELGSPGIPFARAGNIDDGFQLSIADTIHEANVPRAGAKISREGDVVFTSKGTVGRFAWVRATTPRFVYSPQLCFWRVRQPEILSSRYLYRWMKSPAFVMQLNRVKSSTDMADYVSLTDQRRMIVDVPTPELQQRADALLAPVDDMVENLRERIATLRATRDLLLPRLISGELDVSRVPDPASL